MGTKWYYAVHRGRRTGVYETWEEAKQEIDGFAGAVFKKFADRPRAEAFARLGPPRPDALPNDAGTSRPAAAAPQKPRWVAPTDIRRFMQRGSTEDPAASDAFQLRADTQVTLRQSVTDAPPRATGSGATSGVITVYTDGSCLFQGTPRAVAGLGVVFPDFPEHNASIPILEEDGVRATNNRAEIRAILEAFQRADKIDPTRTRAVHIYSDSEYSIKILTQWLTAWKRMNWRRKTGEPVLNRDLLEIIDRARQQRAFRAIHVRAHTGRTDEHSRYNDLADRAASSAALEAQRLRGATPRSSTTH